MVSHPLSRYADDNVSDADMDIKSFKLTTNQNPLDYSKAVHCWPLYKNCVDEEGPLPEGNFQLGKVSNANPPKIKVLSLQKFCVRHSPLPA